ncbi:MAG: DNA mismatch repair protein MutS [Oscillospiraceae bacterium]|nr:DNA mismatch repair protein MutS [Oscillospiraceae bacterium]
MTPMMRQYLDLKSRNKDCILFFRLGDFYEMFGEDAKTVSQELDLVLTTRDKSNDDPDKRIPMCGVPYHSAENYIARLIAKGYKVAICEQIEDPATAKGLVARDIVRVITPGTLMESSMLDESKPNYLCAVFVGKSSAICFADLSTGDISVSEFDSDDIGQLENELSAFAPAEAILGSDNNTESGNYIETLSKLQAHLSSRLDCLTLHDEGRFSGDCKSSVIEQFGQDICIELGAAAICAVGALLSYLSETQKTDISHLQTLRNNAGDSFMALDINTIRNLELVGSLRAGDKKGSLLWALDKTKTPMGRRLIRSWVLRPLLKTAPITRRLNAVSELFFAIVARGELMSKLRTVGDMERLIGKIVYGNAGCRDLKALSSSICMLPHIKTDLAPMRSNALCEISSMDLLSDIAESIDFAIQDDPPFSVREGGFIKDGVDSEIDRLRDLLNNSNAALTDVEAKERKRTGKKLKIGYNKVFGYYIEIPRAQSEDVPGDYIRKQTLANCERFITQELKELETELLTAKDKLAALEYNLFEQLRLNLSSEVARIQETAKMVAELDVFCAFAESAAVNNYCMPEIDISGTLDIRNGRHPTVEIMQQGSLFVPNDTYLDSGASRTAIITGPNMAGKSTYMRQTALIVLMAQIGSFVPAKSAHIGIVDCVYTRIGASDDLSAGKSTFMVEMTEMADILKTATRSSLLVLDEIGRGTSTYDGMSVARAILEYCADKKKLGAKTMFATHYHELTALESDIDGVKNFNISAKKRGDDVIFLRKILPGGADDSYGIEVAGLAGIPNSIIIRAKAVLKALEGGDKSDAVSMPHQSVGAATQLRSDENSSSFEPVLAMSSQISMLDMGSSEVVEKLSAVDLNTLTPLEALNLLYELKKKLL